MPAAASSARPTRSPAHSEPGRLAAFRQGRLWRWLRWPVRVGVLLVVLGVAALTFLYVTVSLPDDPPSLESSVIVDAQGRQVAVLQNDGLRVAVELDDVAPVAVQALIAAEDRGFRDHQGIDPRGLVRALDNNLRGGSTQGGSTITQQLVKNSYLTSERTYARKVREALLAVKLDRRSDKDEILERYLNTVYFGRGTYGIEAASQVYFDTTAAELTTPQAALLIGLLRAPERADPERDPDVARQRRDSVIDALFEVGDITADEAALANASEIDTIPIRSSVTLTAGVGAHVVEWIRQQAIEEFGAEAVYGGGLTIHSTIDLDHQRVAELSVAASLGEPDDPQAALVSVDPDGAVRAHVGGRDFEELQVDLARGADGGGSGRQAGSTFKPVALAAAFEDRTATLATTYPAPAQLTLEPPGGPWTVRNAGGAGFGVLDLAEATARSANTVYAQLMLDVGPERVVTEANELGITTDLAPDPSLVLGTGAVSVMDMTSLYSTFARDGERIDPFVIDRVTDADDRVIFEPTRERRQVLETGAARAVTAALRQVIESGTGTAARLDRPAAGKTGTTQNNADAWFAGYTPNLTTVVWMGYPEGSERPMSDVRGRAVSGGTFPAEIWQRYMAAAHEGVEPSDFAPPPDDLLAPPELPELTLSASPASGPVGTRIEVSGSGYEQCLVEWFVVLEPGGVASEPDTGSDADDRSAALVVPEGLEGAQGRITAFCDRGAGPEPVAETGFAVDAPATTTTTTTATSTTTATPETTTPETTTPETTEPPDETTTTTTTTEPDEPPTQPGITLVPGGGTEGDG